MAEQPLVSVVIPTHQRRERVRRALASLTAQTASPQSFECVVSVDGSTDGTGEMLASFNAPFALRVAEGEHANRAAARNAALRLARGEIVIVLDDDMEAIPQLVERHRHHHPSGSRLCVLGAVPVRIDEDSPRAASYVAKKFDAHLANLSQPEHAFGPRDFYSGNVSLRKETIAEVGGFDAAFTAYGNEDVELSLRLRAAGIELRYDAQAIAHQSYDKGLDGLSRDTLQKGGTTVLLARRHPSAFAALRLASPNDASRAWLALRAVMLRATRRRPRLSEATIALGVWLERLGLWRQPLFYRALLDYLFWAGADAELRKSPHPNGELARLAADLRRGPIDLLLHG
ncbi:MAG TPA: glycosyltransferase [Solirubrobacterales bacterium]|jgi:glycosyltransferase involved in cell wall biosynthesis|nr:glycosyltransferase [Solirubrobacterales bacterium]